MIDTSEPMNAIDDLVKNSPVVTQHDPAETETIIKVVVDARGLPGQIRGQEATLQAVRRYGARTGTWLAASFPLRKLSPRHTIGRRQRFRKMRLIEPGSNPRGRTTCEILANLRAVMTHAIYRHVRRRQPKLRAA